MSQVARTPPPGRAASLDGVLGFERTAAGDGWVKGRFAVVDAVKQAYGLVHGGSYSAFAETLASEATTRAVAHEGRFAVGLSNHTSFVRPVAEGHVHAEARARHRGRTTWVWEVDFSDDDGNLCALARVTLAVREVPGGQPLELPADDGWPG